MQADFGTWRRHGQCVAHQVQQHLPDPLLVANHPADAIALAVEMVTAVFSEHARIKCERLEKPVWIDGCTLQGDRTGLSTRQEQHFIDDLVDAGEFFELHLQRVLLVRRHIAADQHAFRLQTHQRQWGLQFM